MSDPTDEEKAKAREIIATLIRLSAMAVVHEEGGVLTVARALAESRAKALEEAAHIADLASVAAHMTDGERYVSSEIARRIRKLKGTP